ncbi:MAG TPA: TRAM domain-containing protein, partial [Bacteroidales bacterium]
AAKHYKDEIPLEVKQERLDTLMLLQQTISEGLNTTKIGQTLKVIIDREESDYFIGRTEFDSPEVDPEVFISKDKTLRIGQFYDVRITSAGPYDLFGQA